MSTTPPGGAAATLPEGEAASPAPAIPPRASARFGGATLASRFRAVAPHALLALLLTVTLIVAPGYRSVGQLGSLLQLVALLGIVAIGQTLVILIGGIDLSVGATATLANLVIAMTLAGADANLPQAVLAAALIGLGIGLTNGLGIVLLKIPDLIMTLATMTVAMGVGYLVTGGANKGAAAPALRAFMVDRFAGVLTGGIVLWLVLGAVVIVVLRRMVAGRRVFAVGLNRTAAAASGVRVGPLVITL